MEPITIKPKSNSSKTKSDTATKSKETANTKQKPARRNLTAVTIVAGIITLIDENGKICYYRQRGITNIPPQVKLYLVNAGFLHRNWINFKELPSNISIKYEDEDIIGKARATFPLKQAESILGIKP